MLIDIEEPQIVVVKKTTVAHDVVLFDLQSADGTDLPEWSPGAHIDIVINENLTRQYSLCGDPDNRSTWHIAVLREDSGQGGSRFLHDSVAEGDLLTFRGPRNKFPLSASNELLFIAGGIGITPLLPMISEAEKVGLSWQLVYVGRSRKTMPFVSELEEKYSDKVKVFARDEVERPQLHDMLSSQDKSLDVYICGPQSFINDVNNATSDNPAVVLHYELFSPKMPNEPVLNSDFEVDLRKTGKIVKVTPEESILDAIRNAGLRVLSSCGEGTCGTCETKVIEGLVDHRDSLLTQQEQELNNTMMICVSRALSPRITLEL